MQQVLIPRHLSGPPPSPYIRSLGWSSANLKPAAVMIRGDQLSVVCNPKAFDIILKEVLEGFSLGVFTPQETVTKQ